MNIKLGFGLTVLAALIMAGCASTSELTDKPIQLQPDQGIAAIVLDAPNRITQISFVAKDPGASSFEVPDTQGGPMLYMVPVKAGRYCLMHFRYWKTIFKSKQDLGCFTVIAGRITYTGDLIPSGSPLSSEAVLHHEFNFMTFTDRLHKQYPVLASLFPLASAPQPPSGVDATPTTNIMSTWIENISGSNAQAIYIQNNSSWSMQVINFNLTDCINTNPACGNRQMNVTFGPFTRKQIMVIGPVDVHAIYEYHYDYNYRDVD
ncbi:MAG: hypothetical protein KGJ08_00120 [Gammaproteobacteria bacterium]|nr:hypothetical protein [Gammaproteobacteria bacterium]